METFKQIINNDQPVLVDFHATWCGPCKQMAPELVKFARENTGKLRVVKVDVDKNQQAAAQYQIQGVPTLILFRNGEVLWRQSGAMSALQINSFVTPYL